MDIHVHGAAASAEERAAVDLLLGAATSGWEGAARDSERDGRSAHGGRAAREQRHLLLPALHAVQDRVGWVSEGALNYICQRLTVPPADAWGVVTFYHLFATTPRPLAVAHVCDDLACRLRGAEKICDQLEDELGPAGRPQRPGDGTWLRSPCLGLCERAPAALVVHAGPVRETATFGPVGDALTIARALEGDTTELFTAPAVRLAALRRSVPQAGSAGLRLLARVGAVDPGSLDAYRESGGYRALARAIELGPAGVIAELTASRLVGRGGAAFPAGRKWEAVARAAEKKRYVICNADESEPGTFKDRVLLEEDPFAIVEAMTIAGFACGADEGIVYLRGEYPLAEFRLRQALTAARAGGLLGAGIDPGGVGGGGGGGFRFDIAIRRGAGAYICGEETALFNSIEGKRGEPRSKPPFPVEVGVFGKPTLVNNVETLANVPWIVLAGGEKFRALGTAESTGTKLFCLAGEVNRPGLYEVPFGSTLGDLLELAGGVLGGKPLRAVLLGGAAGSFVGPDQLALPLTFEGTRAAGTSLGSGVVLVYSESADLGDALVRIAEFFRHESCGQCVPCRVGTVRQAELLGRLRRRAPLGDRAQEMALFAELAQAMRDASICGLGQTASSAIASALALFDPFPGPSPLPGRTEQQEGCEES